MSFGNIIQDLASKGIVPFYVNGKVFYDLYGQTFDNIETAIFYAMRRM